MNTQKISIRKLAFISGTFIFMGMVVYFLLMKLVGLDTTPELRLLNLVLLLIGVWCTIKYFNYKSGRHIQYFEGLSLGFTTVMISTVMFAVFIGIYLYFIDPVLLDEIKLQSPVMGKYLTPASAMISMIVEGIVSGLIIAFVMMQYFKDDSLHSPFAKRPDNLRPEKE
ncbi:MAG: DUF4199 domain-containing protein [Bacteroidia bacterium]|nr:DUF4199 domain-containing protein [Bacteroidia bacterium]